MDTWPIALQQKLNADDFEVKLGNTVVRSDMDIGMPKVRSRYTDGIDTYSCSILLDFSLYDDLLAFFKTTLNNGSLPFLFTDPFSLTTQTFRFVEPPDIKPLGGRLFRVSMQWEKLP